MLDPRCLGLALALTLAGGAAAGCGGAPTVDATRFHNRPVVWQVDDRRPTPARPRATSYLWLEYYLDVFVHRPITEALRLEPHRRALDVNALGEVPSSTWFTNRIGRFELSPEEVAQGPNRGPNPMEHRPWTVVSSKVGGYQIGFIVEDARGERYLLKFDLSDHPEAETAAAVISQRLLWAAGFHTPEDYLVEFRPEDLLVADDAVMADPFGRERPMRRHDLDTALAEAHRDARGLIRGLASKYLDGEPLGGYAPAGTRLGDPNDLIPHEHRRSLRGQYPIFAWLDHTDVKMENTLDMLVEDPRDPERAYVVHYLVDFGKTLGVMAAYGEQPSQGYAYVWDFAHLARRLVTLGLWSPPWEAVEPPGLVGVGRFDAAHFDPGRWKPRQRHAPFDEMDRHDAFWGTKILMRFTRAHLRAVIAEARLSDPRAARYLLETLVARQRQIGRYWFERVNPLDGFEVVAFGDGHRLCFLDLLLHYRLADVAATTRYTGAAYDGGGTRLRWRTALTPDGAGRACTGPVPRGAGPDGYTVIELVTGRDRRHLEPVRVHLARAPGSAGAAPRIIGIQR